eukprot:3555739-Prymnesium_polylepis.1
MARACHRSDATPTQVNAAPGPPFGRRPAWSTLRPVKHRPPQPPAQPLSPGKSAASARDTNSSGFDCQGTYRAVHVAEPVVPLRLVAIRAHRAPRHEEGRGAEQLCIGEDELPSAERASRPRRLRRWVESLQRRHEGTRRVAIGNGRLTAARQRLVLAAAAAVDDEAREFESHGPPPRPGCKQRTASECPS